MKNTFHEPRLRKHGVTKFGLKEVSNAVHIENFRKEKHSHQSSKLEHHNGGHIIKKKVNVKNVEIENENDNAMVVDEVRDSENIEPVVQLQLSTINRNIPEIVCSNICNEDVYLDDIWKYLIELDSKYFEMLKASYMSKQPCLTWKHRSILVDWLANVCDEYNVSQRAFHICINYIDRFLSQMAVVRNKFQLLGVAALLVAEKIEEIYPIEVNELSYLTGDGFTSRQIKRMEQMLIKVLNYSLTPPPLCSFIEHICVNYNLDEKIKHFALYLADLMLLEGEPYLSHLPSKLAAAAILLARYTLNEENPWPATLENHSGYSLKELSPVVKKQHKTLLHSPLKEEQSIQKKYKTRAYSKVALIKPRSLNLDEEEDEFY